MAKTRMAGDKLSQAQRNAEAREKLGVGVSEPKERQDTNIKTEWE